ncbi:MAG: hypothetical protein WCJ98_08495 [Mycobacteriaceae bacterium]
MTRFLRNLVLAAAAGAALAAAVTPAASADSADRAVTVFPGMEIRQQSTMCTLGFVDPVARIAFSAGHCRGNGPVTDRNGRLIGVVTTSRDNTPDGSVVRVDQVISDYETITLNADVVVNNLLPGGRALVADSVVPMAVGQQVCHFGIVTGESCGTVERINNGWFTMTNGVVSQRGDSGGPVYVPTADGKAVMVGIFNSTWGRLPAAVSWQATGQQLREDSIAVTAAVNSALNNPVVNAAARN